MFLCWLHMLLHTLKSIWKYAGFPMCVSCPSWSMHFMSGLGVAVQMCSRACLRSWGAARWQAWETIVPLITQGEVPGILDTCTVWKLTKGEGSFPRICCLLQRSHWKLSAAMEMLELKDVRGLWSVRAGLQSCKLSVNISVHAWES